LRRCRRRSVCMSTSVQTVSRCCVRSSAIVACSAPTAIVAAPRTRLTRHRSTRADWLSRTVRTQSGGAPGLERRKETKNALAAARVCEALLAFRRCLIPRAVAGGTEPGEDAEALRCGYSSTAGSARWAARRKDPRGPGVGVFRIRHQPQYRAEPRGCTSVAAFDWTFMQAK
jgi:hypothetical protein